MTMAKPVALRLFPRARARAVLVLGVFVAFTISAVDDGILALNIRGPRSEQGSAPNLQGRGKVNNSDVSIGIGISIGLNTSSEFDDCSVVTVHKEPVITASSLVEGKWNGNSIKTIWVPSYPGSGAELFRNLILTLTGGMDAAEIYGRPYGCSQHPATCKTHCPLMGGCPSGLALKRKGKRIDNYYHQSAILLLRNPLNAMPSFVNHNYEAENKLKFHSVQAPESFWKAKRDQTFQSLFGEWINLIIWWTTNERQSTYDVAAIVQYERLRNEQHGPLLLHQVAEQLRKANLPVAATSMTSNNTMDEPTLAAVSAPAAAATNLDANTANVPPMHHRWYQCVWQRIVNAPKSTSKRAPHKYIPSYTAGQQAYMIEKLDDLIHKFNVSAYMGVVPVNDSVATSDNYQTKLALRDILLEYRHEITTNIRLDGE